MVFTFLFQPRENLNERDPCVVQVVIPVSASDAATATPDVACFLFDLAGAAADERVELVSVLTDALQRAGTTVVINSHDVASMLRRALGIELASIFDSQVMVLLAFQADLVVSEVY